MRILHIINTLAVGGAETTLYRLVVEDTKNEHIIISLKSEGKYLSLIHISEPTRRYAISYADFC
mgnify:CR=1 FL=1